jgi:hypothetical protein
MPAEGYPNLIPFEKGHQGPHVGRPHALSDPEYCQQVAALFVAGITRAQMAEELGVTESTIKRWRKDPRIKAAAIPLIEERVVQITRKVDSAIEARLQDPSKLSVRELIEIRKEFLAGNLRSQAEKLDEGTVSEAMVAIEKNPQLVDELLALLTKKPQGGLVTEEQDGISTETLGS